MPREEAALGPAAAELTKDEEQRKLLQRSANKSHVQALLGPLQVEKSVNQLLDYPQPGEQTR